MLIETKIALGAFLTSIVLSGCSTPSKYVGKSMPDILARTCPIERECTQTYKNYNISFSLKPRGENAYQIEGVIKPFPWASYGELNTRIHFIFFVASKVVCEHKVLVHGMRDHDIKYKDTFKCKSPIEFAHIVGYSGTIREM